MTKLTKRPWLNAVMASLYITGLVLLMNWGSQMTVAKGDTVMMPIAMISVFTLSAAVMGYLFLAEPIMMFLEGKKKAAVDFFLKTVSVFAGITLIIYVTVLSI